MVDDLVESLLDDMYRAGHPGAGYPRQTAMFSFSFLYENDSSRLTGF